MDPARLVLHGRDRRGRAADERCRLSLGDAGLRDDGLDAVGDVEDLGSPSVESRNSDVCTGMPAT